MRTPTLPLLLTSLLVVGCAPDTASEEAPADAAAAAPAAAPATGPVAPPTTPEAKIASAMSAAPPEIASQAAIMDMDASGAMTELKAGTNGWVCFPDVASTPGTDPICADKAWQEWFAAYTTKTPPKVSGVGVAYMLAGGSDASNTDPFATEPAPGQQWVDSGAHVMVLPTDVAMLDAFPTEHSQGGPFVMWKGTAYAHLMVPVHQAPH
jgi:hypothetical protein